MYHRKHLHTDGFTAADDEERWIAVTIVRFKDEDEVDGVAIGPVWQNDTELAWMPKPDAIAYAERIGARFEEV